MEFAPERGMQEQPQISFFGSSRGLFHLPNTVVKSFTEPKQV